MQSTPAPCSESTTAVPFSVAGRTPYSCTDSSSCEMKVERRGWLGARNAMSNECEPREECTEIECTEDSAPSGNRERNGTFRTARGGIRLLPGTNHSTSKSCVRLDALTTSTPPV